MVWMRGCQGSFRTPPSVQSASTVAGPETLICFNFTSDWAGSKRMVNALRYLLKPVTSLVGSTNLQRALLSCPSSHGVVRICNDVQSLSTVYTLLSIDQLVCTVIARSGATCRQSHMLSPRCKVWLQEHKLRSSICLQSSANTSGVKLPVTKY